MPPNGDPEGNAVIIFFRMKIELSGAHYRGGYLFMARPPGFACGETSEPGFASPVGHSVSKKEQPYCSLWVYEIKALSQTE